MALSARYSQAVEAMMGSYARVGIGLVLVLVPALTTAQTTGHPGAAPLPVQREVTGQLGGSINNAGLQQTLAVSWTRPLVRSTHPLVKGAHLSSGVTGALTPALGRIGGWLEFAPLSILEFRAGFDHSSYFGTFNSLQGFDSYTDRFDPDARDARGGARAGTAKRVYLSPTIKLQFGPVVIASTAEADGWWSTADARYFYEPTHDTLLESRGGGVFSVSSVIMYRRPLASGSVSVGMIHQETEAPIVENNIEKYGVIGIREFGGKRFGLPNARVTGVIARYSADPHKQGEWTAAFAVGFSIR
jgi:hypothetical protein